MARERFVRARIVQQRFERQLAAVARQINGLIKGVAPDGDVKLRDMPALNELMERYSHTLEPWAESVTYRMQAEVSQRDYKAWTDLGQTMGRELRLELNNAPAGQALRESLQEQIKAITSLPLRASERVYAYAQKMLAESGRADELKKQILRTGHVSVGQAKVIARTAVATVSSKLTQVRAEHLGSEGYFWRTARDRDVRPAHKKLEGKFILWSQPPVVDSKGRRAHAGQDIQCRCYPEPTLPDIV